MERNGEASTWVLMCGAERIHPSLNNVIVCPSLNNVSTPPQPGRPCHQLWSSGIPSKRTR